MQFNNLLVQLTIWIIAVCKFVLCNNSVEKEDDDNWFLSSADNRTLRNKTPSKIKQWNRESLCDHDPVTSIILKMILDAQQRMAEGDNSTGLLPLDPLHIPEFVMEKEEVTSENNNDTSGRRVQANIEDVYLKDWSKFNVTGINADMGRMLINISVALEWITISGSGRLKMGPLKWPIFGKGKFFFKPQGVSAFIYSVFGTHENGTRYLKDFDFGVTLKKLQIIITGPLRPVRRWNLFEAIFSRLGASLFNRIEQRMHPKLQERWSQEISKRMGTFKMLREEILEDIFAHSVYCFFG